MRAIEYLTTVGLNDLNEAMDRWYSDSQVPPERFQEFLDIIRVKPLIRTPNLLQINHFEERCLLNREHDQIWLDCSLLDTSDDTIYSMSFMPWGEVLDLEVVNHVHLELTDADIAAAIYWELTWHGFEEQMQERSEEIRDRMDEVDRAIEDNGGTTDNLPGFRDFGDFLAELYDSDEERKKSVAKIKLELLSTVRYKNGIMREEGLPDLTKSGS